MSNPCSSIYQKALLTLILVLNLPAAAQPDKGNITADPLSELATEAQQIRLMLERFAMPEAAGGDGMMLRIDRRIVNLHKSLPAASQLPSDATAPPSAEERTGLFKDLTQWALGISLSRVSELNARIRREQENFSAFELSAEALISRAFVHDLRAVQLEHLQAALNTLNLRREAGVETTDQRSELETTLVMTVEGLNGQISLDAMTLRELRERQRENPESQELVAALGAVERKQSRSITYMDQLISLLQRLGLNTAEHEALLVAERGVVGVELMNWEVFSRLMQRKFDEVKRQLVSNGPNVVIQLLTATLVLAVFWGLAGLSKKLMQLVMQRRAVDIGQLREDTIITLTYALVIGLGVVAALSALGISLVPMLAGLGIAGVIIGFALQDSLANLASGWMILLVRPFDTDDHIQVAGDEGIVKRMNLVATTIAGFDNTMHIVPNSRIWGNTIINYTSARLRRIDVEVSFSYNTDIDTVEDVLLDLVKEDKKILTKPAPIVHFGEMGSSSLTTFLKIWVKTPDYWEVRFSIGKRIKTRFDKEGILIPYPQLDVHLHAMTEGTHTGLK